VDALDRGWRKNRVTDSRRIARSVQGIAGSETARALRALCEVGETSLTADAARAVATALDCLIDARILCQQLGAMGPNEQAAAVAEDAVVARAVSRAVADMAAVEGAPFTLRDVRRVLPTIDVGGTSGERPGFVQVTEMARIGTRRFDTVIIGGLTAGESPVGGAETIGDELGALVGVEPEARPADLARLRFYMAVSRARNELVLLRREEMSDGTAVRPSVLWEEVLDAYRTSDDEPDEWPTGAPALIRLRAGDVAEAAPVFTPGRREARAALGRGAQWCPELTRGAVSDARALAGLASQETYSASEIEAYLQCPYRWFYERVVRPGEIDSAVDARAVGSLSHDLLRDFYGAWTMPERMRVTPESLAEASRVFERVAAGAGEDLRALGLEDEIAIARGVRWARGIVEDDAMALPGFVPAGHEVGFGGETGEFDFGGVKFRGRIDRVDLSDEAIFITDYKSARSLPGVARFAEEGRVQIVVYAEAARAQHDGRPVAGSVYRSLRTHEMRGFWRADLLHGFLEHGNEDDSIGSAGYEALVADAEDRVAAAVTGIRAGDVPRRPAKPGACAFCPLAPQCEGSR
jgi:hypothetical protein